MRFHTARDPSAYTNSMRVALITITPGQPPLSGVAGQPAPADPLFGNSIIPPRVGPSFSESTFVILLQFTKSSNFVHIAYDLVIPTIGTTTHSRVLPRVFESAEGVR